MEMEILKTMNWELKFTSACEFVHLWLNQGVVFTNDKVRSTIEKLKNETCGNRLVAQYVRKYSKFLLDVCL